MLIMSIAKVDHVSVCHSQDSTNPRNLMPHPLITNLIASSTYTGGGEGLG